MTSDITFIGVGNMGAALANAQLKAGAQITLWNRTADRPSVTELVSAGAKFEPSLAKAINASPITIICVLDYSNVHQILDPISVGDGSSGPLSGKTIINLTNGTPQDGRKMNEWMAGQEVRVYIDGGVMAAPYMVGTAQSFVFYSGADEATMQRLKGMLEVFGRVDYYGEDPGTAALFDTALLSGMYGMFMGVLMCVSLLRTRGGKLEPTITGLVNPLLRTFLATNEKVARAIDEGDFGAYGHPMAMQAAGMQNIGRAFEEEGVDPGSFRAFFNLAQELVQQGRGNDGIAALSDLMLLSKKP